MLIKLFQILLFIPFAFCMLAFAGVGRLIKRLNKKEFFGKKAVLGFLGAASLVGVFFLGIVGKIYE